MGKQISCKVRAFIPRWRATGSTILALLVLLALVQPAQAKRCNLKISGEMPDFGEVPIFENYEVSPDGRFVVYIADQQTDEVYELFRVYLTGGEPVKLSGVLVEGGDVWVGVGFAISPDSQRVVYKADQETDGVIELYSVPLAGGAPVKLNGALVEGGDVEDFSISLDSQRVVYKADQQGDGRWELYSVPIVGGDAIKLNSSLGEGGQVRSFEISPDSQRVVYEAVQESFGVTELYSVPLAGGTPVKLNDDLVEGGSVAGFRISPDSQRVVYRADQETYAVDELYSVFTSGGTPVKLNGALVEGGLVRRYSISPDSRRVVYTVEQETLGERELYSVLITGIGRVKLNPGLVYGGTIFVFKITPDSQHVLYAADQRVDDILELYSVPLGGGPALLISHNRKLYWWFHNVTPIEVNADGEYAVFYAWDEIYPDAIELCSVSIDGNSIYILTSEMKWSSLNRFKINPNSHTVEFFSDLVETGIINLVQAPINRDYYQWFNQLNGWLVEGGDVVSWKYAPGGNSVIYQADQEVNDKFELYVTFDGIFLPLVRR